MTPEQFAYWLQGFFELSGTDQLTAAQVKMVREHLATVFHKVTPPLGPSPGYHDLGTFITSPTTFDHIKVC